MSYLQKIKKFENCIFNNQYDKFLNLLQKYDVKIVNVSILVKKTDKNKPVLKKYVITTSQNRLYIDYYLLQTALIILPPTNNIVIKLYQLALPTYKYNLQKYGRRLFKLNKNLIKTKYHMDMTSCLNNPTLNEKTVIVGFVNEEIGMKIYLKIDFNFLKRRIPLFAKDKYKNQVIFDLRIEGYPFVLEHLYNLLSYIVYSLNYNFIPKFYKNYYNL